MKNLLGMKMGGTVTGTALVSITAPANI